MRKTTFNCWLITALRGPPSRKPPPPLLLLVKVNFDNYEDNSKRNLFSTDFRCCSSGVASTSSSSSSSSSFLIVQRSLVLHISCSTLKFLISSFPFNTVLGGSFRACNSSSSSGGWMSPIIRTSVSSSSALHT